MKIQTLDIDISKIGHAYASALKTLMLKHKPEQLTVVTFTLSEEGISELNAYVKTGVKVRAVAAKLPLGVSLRTLRFDCWINRHNHSKIWMLDEMIYVGSSNMAGDTIINLMLKVTAPEQQLAIIKFVESLRSGKLVHRTHVIP